MIEEATAAVANGNDKKKKNGTDGEAKSSELCSQVSTVFGELSRVQDEVRTRLLEFGERETEIARLRQELEEERDKLDAEAVRVERLGRKIAAREETFRLREEAVERRETAVHSFQEMLVHMVAALDDPTPTNLARAFETAQQALQSGHTAAHSVDAAHDASATGESDDPEVAAADRAAGGKSAQDPKLSDFSPEELRRLEMLSQLGTASKQEIARQIRAERENEGDANGKGGKGAGKRRWLF